MTALRQEAMQILNNVPENVLADFITHMQNFKIPNETPVQNEPETEIKPEKENPITEEDFQAFLHSGEGIDPKKAAALKAIEEWQEKNKEFLNSEIECDMELEEAETETRRQPRKLTEEEFQQILHSGSGIDPKKAAAFARLEEWRKNNTVHYPAGTDWKKEFEEAICESEKYKKYFVAD